MLNLPAIDKGVDSFELRIWVSTMWVPEILTLIKFTKNGWVTYQYLYTPNDSVLDSMSVYYKETPKEIDKIVTFLTRNDILELPSQVAIRNFHDNIGDGQTCTIEIATKHYYKVLKYHCPEHFSNEPNNIKFMSIVNYLNPYFNFYTPWCGVKE